MSAVERPELRVFGREPPRRWRAMPDAVLGMWMFVGVEAMFFAGFISAFVIVKASFLPGTWPPPDQPRLPVELTAFTTLLLLASGVLVGLAGRRWQERNVSAARALLWAGVGAGALFVGVQGFEWARLLAQGLTMTSSPYGAFFYLIVGVHALHALPAMAVLAWQAAKMNAGTLTDDGFAAARIFWGFVVLVWPVLYWKVYL